MPIDTSIYSRFQPQQIDIATPLQALRQRQLQRQQFEQQQQLAAEQLKGAKLNNQAAEFDLANLPAKRAFELKKAQQDWEKADLATKKQKIDIADAQLEGLGTLALTVRNDATWKAAIQQAVQKGYVEPEQAQQYAAMPYDPAFVQNVVAQSKAGRERLGQIRQQLADEESKRHNQSAEASTEALRTETARHNRAMETKESQGPSAPAEIQEYRLAQSQGFKGTFAEWKKEIGTRPTQTFTQESRLRSDLTRDIKNYPETVDQLRRMEVGEADPTAAGDIAILFNFMKMLDPNSVVRESEFATAAQAGSLFDRAQGLLNRVQNGQRLSASQRKDFVDTARRLFNSVSPRYEKIIKGYKETAERNQLDWRNVTAGIGSTDSPTELRADPLEGRTATGPNGQKIIRKGGQWVPMQ